MDIVFHPQSVSSSLCSLHKTVNTSKSARCQMYSLMEEVIDSLKKKKNGRMLVRIISVSLKFCKEDLKICRSSVIILTRYPVIRCDSSLKKILINSGIPPNFA